MIPRSLVTCAALLLAAAAARAQCPSNHMQADTTIANSSLPTGSRSGGQCSGFGCGSAFVSYDIPHAFLILSANVSGDGGTSAQLIVQDDFRLIGLAPGGSAALTVKLHVNADFCGASLSDANGHTVGGFGYDINGFVVDVSLPIAAVEDQPFRLQFELDGSANYLFGASGSGNFSFDGIPSGAAVVSCNGFVSANGTPVHATSWGKLKSMYR